MSRDDWDGLAPQIIRFPAGPPDVPPADGQFAVPPDFLPWAEAFARDTPGWHVQSRRGPVVLARRVAADRTPPRPDTGPCPHAGRPVSVAGTAKAYHRCDHPDRVALRLAEVTCGCAGCGPRCPGYPAGGG